MSLYRASKIVKQDQRTRAIEGRTDGLHWLYRCTSCGRLITKLEILEARTDMKSNLCSCGGKTIRPTRSKWWEEVFYPRCWKLIFAIYMKRIAPRPDPLPASEQAEADRVGREKTRAFDREISRLVRKKA